MIVVEVGIELLMILMLIRGRMLKTNITLTTPKY